MTIGSLTASEMGIFKYVFYVFRPEYMIVSGIVAFIAGCGILALIIRTIKNLRFFDIAVLLVNIEYIIYYFRFLIKQ